MNEGTITTYTAAGWGYITTIREGWKGPDVVENVWFHCSDVWQKEEPIIGQLVSFDINPIRAGKHRRAENITVLR
jgi:hypothetical protein